MIGVVYEVGTYRKALGKTVAEGDKVIEIGPHQGKSTDAYIDNVEKTILVDKGKDSVDALTSYCQEHENAVFVCSDAREFDSMRLVQTHLNKCDVLAVDMGGGRYPDTVFKVWATWAAVFRPRDSIIRCRGLAEFIRRSKILDDSLPETFEESGWLSEYGRGTPIQMKEQLDELQLWLK